jgi:hypothetical protein
VKRPFSTSSETTPPPSVAKPSKTTKRSSSMGKRTSPTLST